MSELGENIPLPSAERRKINAAPKIPIWKDPKERDFFNSLFPRQRLGLTHVDANNYPKRGEVNFKSESFNIHLAYEPFSINIFTMSTKPDVRYISRRIPKWQHKKWKTLKEFSLRSDINPVSIKLNSNELSKIIPPDYRVLFMPDTYSSMFVATDAKTIFIRGDLAKLDDILGFFHELGHCVETKRQENNENFDIGAVDNARRLFEAHQPMTKKQLDLIWMEERNAWAYALKQIKPFLREPKSHSLLTKENILDYIHNYALKSYRKGIGVKIDRGELIGEIDRSLAHWLR